MSESDWEAQDYRDRGILRRIRILEEEVRLLKENQLEQAEQIEILQHLLLKQEGQHERANN